MRRSLQPVASLFVVALITACGGGGGDAPTTPPPVAGFQASGTAAAPDGVRLVEAARNGNTVDLSVVVGGPSTSNDIFGFAFDLVIGTTGVLAYSGLDPVVGPALDDSDPSCSGAEALASQSGDRVVVGVTKLGAGCPGNGIGAGEPALVTLRFQVTQTGSSTLAFDGSAEALDSLGNTIGSIAFDGVSATVTGS
ncbi:hypothetical protein ABI59_00955 [Acidobacteria bacterium Mor1]|nr:hypothetical protein ABI59_00955 [Acidobacteria bacterium Mor1]